MIVWYHLGQYSLVRIFDSIKYWSGVHMVVLNPLHTVFFSRNALERFFTSPIYFLGVRLSVLLNTQVETDTGPEFFQLFLHHIVLSTSTPLIDFYVLCVLYLVLLWLQYLPPLIPLLQHQVSKPFFFFKRYLSDSQYLLPICYP